MVSLNWSEKYMSYLVSPLASALKYESEHKICQILANDVMNLTISGYYSLVGVATV
jgi:hypothetical protein